MIPVRLCVRLDEQAFPEELMTKTLFDGPHNELWKQAGFDMLVPLRGLLLYGLRHKLFTMNEIMSWFQFTSNESKEGFHKRIAELKKSKSKRKKK